MKVWRVEDERGIGPWHSDKPSVAGLWYAGERHHSLDNWVPAPKRTDKHKFAFRRMDTLNFVFEGVLEELLANGFKIVELNVGNNSFKGPQDQVMFVDKRVF